jgi:putative transposase
MNHRDPFSRRRAMNEPGHAHGLTFTCYRRYPFFAKERPCGWLMEAIAEARQSLDLDLWAYVFMPDHVHLILRPRRASYDISAILKAVKAPVGRRAIAHLVENAPEWLPRLTRRRGERSERLFWQPGGGYDRNVVEPKTLAGSIEYLHLNPVRKSFVERASDWRWSSAGWYEGRPMNDLRPDPIPPEWVDPS